MNLEYLKRLLNAVPSWGIHIERASVALSLMSKNKSLILDVGCGNGGFSRKIAKCGRKVVGVDLIKKRPADDFLYAIAKAEMLPFKNFIFDQIFCLDVMEHVKNDELVAREVNRTLKKGGELIITAPSNFWKFPYYNFMRVFTYDENKLLKMFGHFKKGYSLEQIKNLFKNLKIVDKKYFCNRVSAFGYDIEFSRLYGVENIILKIFGLFLFINFKRSPKKYGTHIGVKLSK